MSTEKTYKPKEPVLPITGKIKCEGTRQRLAHMRYLGLSYAAAARSVGVTPECLRLWRKRDESLERLLDDAHSKGLEEHGQRLARADDPRLSLEVLKLKDEDFRPDKAANAITIVLALPSLLPASAMQVEYSLLDEAAKAGALPANTSEG